MLHIKTVGKKILPVASPLNLKMIGYASKGDNSDKSILLCSLMRFCTRSVTTKTLMCSLSGTFQVRNLFLVMLTKQDHFKDWFMIRLFNFMRGNNADVFGDYNLSDKIHAFLLKIDVFVSFEILD